MRGNRGQAIVIFRPNIVPLSTEKRQPEGCLFYAATSTSYRLRAGGL